MLLVGLGVLAIVSMVFTLYERAVVKHVSRRISVSHSSIHCHMPATITTAGLDECLAFVRHVGKELLLDQRSRSEQTHESKRCSLRVRRRISRVYSSEIVYSLFRSWGNGVSWSRLQDLSGNSTMPQRRFYQWRQPLKRYAEPELWITLHSQLRSAASSYNFDTSSALNL